MNPRAAINDLLTFQASPFGLLGTSPNKLTNKRYSISIPVDTAEKVGFEPTAPCGVTGFQDQLLKPLGHLSMSDTCKNRRGVFIGDPSEIRTPDTLIKSQVLCRLS